MGSRWNSVAVGWPTWWPEVDPRRAGVKAVTDLMARSSQGEAQSDARRYTSVAK